MAYKFGNSCLVRDHLTMVACGLILPLPIRPQDGVPHGSQTEVTRVHRSQSPAANTNTRSRLMDRRACSDECAARRFALSTSRSCGSAKMRNRLRDKVETTFAMAPSHESKVTIPVLENNG